MNLQGILLLVVIANCLVTSYARYIRAITCEKDSFKSDITGPNQVTYTDVTNVGAILKFTDKFEDKEPPNNVDKEEYKNECLKSKIYKLSKKDSADEHKIITRNPSENDVEFTNLEYLVEYTLDISYTQTTFDEVFHATNLDLITCHGKPEKVINLKASKSSDGKLEISWDKPSVIRAPKVCYYELTVTPVDDPANKMTYKSTEMKETINVNTSKEYTIEVFPINAYRDHENEICYTVTGTNPRIIQICDEKVGDSAKVTYPHQSDETTNQIKAIFGFIIFNKM